MAERFIDRLHGLLSKDPYTKSIFITSSRSQGLQWLEQISRKYGYVENVEVNTIESFILNKVQFKLFKLKKQYIHEQQIFWIIQRLMYELVNDHSLYISENNLSFGIVKRFASAVSELRHAGLKAADMDPDQSESKEKGMYIKALLERYEQALESEGLADFPALIPLLSTPEHKVNDQFIIYEHINLSKIEREALKITCTHLVLIKAEVGFLSEEAKFPIDNVSFFHTTGIQAEIRKVFRHMAEQNLACDQVEIITSNEQLYTPLIYAFSKSNDIPCSFAGGLPAVFNSMEKAAYSYLEWIESNFKVDAMVTALRHGHIRLQDDEGNIVSGTMLASALEDSCIGWGRERYRLLGKKAQNEHNEKNMQALKILNTFFEEMLSTIPKIELTPLLILKSLSAFLNTYGMIKDPWDREIINNVNDHLQSMKFASPVPMTFDHSIKYVKEILSGIHIGADPLAQSGAIRVSTIQNGALSGRPYTYVVGMDEASWTQHQRQDPVLLDEERQRISYELPLSSHLMEQILLERNSRLASLNGHVMMSYVAYQLADHSENHPAFEMLQLYRRKMGLVDADLHHLKSSLGKPIYYAQSESISLDGVDKWMQHLVDNQDRVLDGKSLLQSQCIHLSNGDKAKRAREDFTYGEYDGLVDTSQYKLNFIGTEGKRLSASRLEMYAACPLKFYYQAVLGVYPKGESIFDRSVWLDPMQRGLLLHEIMELYMRDRVDTSRGNPITHDMSRLNDITEKAIQQTIEDIPAPSQAVCKKECDQIRADAAVFYQMESQRTTSPKHFEYEIHDENEAFNLEISEEISLPLRGFVDRIDEITPHQYKIMDYKTGKSMKYKKSEYFAGGTMLQHALYAMAVEQKLRSTGTDPDAEVITSSYVFPTVRGMGEEVQLVQNRRADLSKILTHMLQGMEQGLFPPTQDSGNCRFCDYQEVCGNHAELMKDKLDDKERLTAILEVNRYE
jgi:ATP-dependent helicase/nuclease subunit B